MDFFAYNFLDLTTFTGVFNNFQEIIALKSDWNGRDSIIWGVIWIGGGLIIYQIPHIWYKFRPGPAERLRRERAALRQALYDEIRRARIIRGKAFVFLTVAKYERYFFFLYWHLNMKAFTFLLCNPSTFIRWIVKIMDFFFSKKK